MPKIYTIDSEAVVNQPIEKVFEFFSKAENLEKITPDWLKFRIKTPIPIEMCKGQLIEYELRLLGLPFTWKTEITEWDPPNRFIDTQIKGPYILWVHEHKFIDLGATTKMLDHVDYSVPGWFLAPVIHKLFVRKKVEAIFKYRSKIIRTLFK